MHHLHIVFLTITIKPNLLFTPQSLAARGILMAMTEAERAGGWTDLRIDFVPSRTQTLVYKIAQNVYDM